MAPVKKKSAQQDNRGAVLIVSMIFVLIFSALAVSMATMSGTNVQLASNQHKVGSAIASTESGLEAMRYWLNRVEFPSSTLPSDYFGTIVGTLQSDLSANSITNITIYNNGTIPPVPLDSASGQAFEGEILIDANNSDILQLSATGGNDITRTIRVQYDIQPYEYPIFDFGMATKGPVHFLGNPTVNGVNSNSEADIFIESSNNNLAMLVTGNCNFDGNISVANSIANVALMGAVQIAGDTGQTAIDNHINIGADPPQFPVPDTQHFQQYATGPVIDSSTDLSSPGMTITNATIAAGTDPNFLGNVIIEGILYIEQPNIVTFQENVDSRGMIVAEGDPNFTGANNSISFLGNFVTNPVPAGVQFDAIRQEEGSSILAPAFSIDFAGNFSALSGVMAVSGAHFSGNVNATIEGTILNYSDNPTVIEGNARLNFDRSDNITVPAGFDTHRILKYKPASYEEIPQ